MTSGNGFCFAAGTPPARAAAMTTQTATAEKIRTMPASLFLAFTSEKIRALRTSGSVLYSPARGADEVPARRVAAAAALVQRRRRHAEPRAAGAASGDRAAGRP